MIKKILAIILCVFCLFGCLTVGAQSPEFSADIDKTEVSVGEWFQVTFSAPRDMGIIKVTATLSINSYFEYDTTGLNFDDNSLKYTLSFKPSSQPVIINCKGIKIGSTKFTISNISYTDSQGTHKCEDISFNINVTPKYKFIYTKQDLNNVRNDLNGNYLLMNDIEFTEADFEEGGDFYNDGFGWKPIGAVVRDSFKGTFNGNGFTVSGLKISKAYYNHCGLFGVNGGKIFNLRLKDVNIDATIGINMSNQQKNTEIKEIIDYNDKDIWTQPDTAITEESLNNYDRTSASTAMSGGICGFNLGTITDSYCSGSITGNKAVGGVAGQNNGIISGCATNVVLKSELVAGGLVGSSGTYSNISDAVTQGSVTAPYSGGIMGLAKGVITRAYTTALLYGENKKVAFANASGVTASEIYAFGNYIDDGKSEIMALEQISQLKFTGGEWEYRTEIPYPKALANLMAIKIIAGDVNADGKVDTVDLAELKLNLASGEESGIGADLNQDAKVDTTDLAALKIKLAADL